MGRIIRSLSSDGSVSCSVINSTDIVARAESIHQTSATATAALGRLLTAASLIGGRMKAEAESLTLRIKGDGEIGAVIAVSDYKGNVKGYVSNPVVEIPLNEKGKLDVSGAIGANGTLNVMREFGHGDPYIGTIELVSGEIAEDITAYYAQSEQTPTACALGVLVNTDLTVLQAGGFLVQLLPDATETTIAQLEKNISKIEAFTTMLSNGKTIEDIMGIILEDIEYSILEESQVDYICGCSRERVEKALISIGKEDLTSLREEEKVTEVDCHFCNRKYRFNKDELQQLIDTIDTKAKHISEVV